MTEPVSLDELRRAARQETVVHDDLVRLVRIADHNGIPKTTIATAIGKSRETVRRYCAGDDAGEGSA